MMLIWVFSRDGVILQAESESELQNRLNLVCHKRIIVVNQNETQITHRRNKSRERKFPFSVASECVGSYKCLALFFDEFMTLEIGFRCLGNLDSTITNMQNASVVESTKQSRC